MFFFCYFWFCKLFIYIISWVKGKSQDSLTTSKKLLQISVRLSWLDWFHNCQEKSINRQVNITQTLLFSNYKQPSLLWESFYRSTVSCYQREEKFRLFILLFLTIHPSISRLIWSCSLISHWPSIGNNRRGFHFNFLLP